MLLPLGNMLPIVFGPGAGVLLCPVCTLVLSPLLPGLTPSPTAALNDHRRQQQVRACSTRHNGLNEMGRDERRT